MSGGVEVHVVWLCVRSGGVRCSGWRLRNASARKADRRPASGRRAAKGRRAGLDYARRFVDIPAAPHRRREANVMDQTVQKPLGRRIHWENVSTVLSAAILIGAEVFGAAYAGGWAIAGLFQLGEYGVYALQILFFFIGVAVMVGFVRNAQRVEPFTYR
jgi:hypothetical protein